MTKDWEKYQSVIRDLYSQHSLATVRQIMIDQYGFQASIRAYRGRLDRWGCRKYNRRKRQSSVSSGGSASGDHSDNGGAGPAAVALDPTSTGADQYHEAGTNFYTETNDVGGEWTHNNAATSPDTPYHGSTSQYSQTHRRSSSSQNYDGQGRTVLSSSSSSTSAPLGAAGYQPQLSWGWPVTTTDTTITDTTTSTAAAAYHYLDYPQQQPGHWSQSSGGGYGNAGDNGSYGYDDGDQLTNNPVQTPYSTNAQGPTTSGPNSSPQTRGGRHHHHSYGATTDNVQGYGTSSQSHSERSRRR